MAPKAAGEKPLPTSPARSARGASSGHAALVPAEAPEQPTGQMRMRWSARAGGRREWWQRTGCRFRLLPRCGVGGCGAQRGAGRWLGSAACRAASAYGDGMRGEEHARMPHGRRGGGTATPWGHAGAEQALRSANPSAAGVRSWPVSATAGGSASTVATADMGVEMEDVWRLGRSPQAALRPAELFYPWPHGAPGSGVQASQALWHWIVQRRTTLRVRRRGTSGCCRGPRGGDRPKTTVRVPAVVQWRVGSRGEMEGLGWGGWAPTHPVGSEPLNSISRPPQIPSRAARTDTRRTVGAAHVQGRTMPRLRPPRRPRP